MVQQKKHNTVPPKAEIWKEKAQKLYQHGMSAAETAEVLDLPYTCICDWTKTDEFRNARRVMRLRRSHMKRLLLSSFEASQAGKKPAMSPQELLQYATAYEKLSDKKQHLGCWYEAFEQLTEAWLKKIEALQQTKDKNRALKQLQRLRNIMAQVLKKRTQAAFHE